MPNSVQIILGQKQKDSMLILFSKEYECKGKPVLNVEKTCEVMTKRVYKRVEATKRGVRTQFQMTKPFKIMVKFNNQWVLDTDKIASATALHDMIKVNATGYKNNPTEEKQRFHDALDFIINEGFEAVEDMKKCFSIEKTENNTEQAEK